MEGALASTVQILETLVAFDTTSRLSNLLLIDYVTHAFERHGIKPELVRHPQGHKANLLARIGPDVPGGLVLSGHTDVVPVDGQEWATLPFELTEKDGKLYGRGTSDMKSFLACCLSLLPELSQGELKKPIYFAFSYDEEVGCLGVPSLVAHLVEKYPRPDLVLIGEPTEMQVATAHKGVYSFETVVTGLERHSSDTARGVNAVQYACELVHFLSELSREVAQKGKQNPRFDPSYSTVHVGVIEGGIARNIIPRSCRFLWEIRPLPGDPVEPLLKRFEETCASLEKKMQAVAPETSIRTTPMSRMKAMEILAEGQAWLPQVMAAAQTNSDGVVSFGTEAGVFQEGGIPAIVCGPGSIREAHKPNEFIEIAQIEKALGFIRELSQALCR